jgi:hypothetical protein
MYTSCPLGTELIDGLTAFWQEHIDIQLCGRNIWTYNFVAGTFTEMTLSVVLCGYAIARDTTSVPFRDQPSYGIPDSVFYIVL